jgi:two-component system alkaline phosphatase synthesis response regulator PhoP
MIYCVEDDISIRELIVYTLKLSGFEALGIERGEELFAKLEEEIPELIILDIMLPGEDGLTILKRIRMMEAYSDIPIIMATAKGSEFDRVKGLDMGADDYLSKPFGMMEMVSRVKAVLRRGRQKEPLSELHFSSIQMDLQKRTTEVDGRTVDLTLKEYELLKLFLENPGIVFTRQQILEKIWGDDFLGASRTIDVHIGTLRNKLGESGRNIRTVHGVGYCLKEENDG